MTGANMLNLETSPSTVPTGQTVLHHVLPCLHARNPMMTSVTDAITSEETDLIHTSVL